MQLFNKLKVHLSSVPFLIFFYESKCNIFEIIVKYKNYFSVVQIHYACNFQVQNLFMHIIAF